MRNPFSNNRMIPAVASAVIINGLILSQYIYYWINSTPSDLKIVYALSLFLGLEFLAIFIGVFVSIKSFIKFSLVTIVPLTCILAFLISYEASYYLFFFFYLLAIANKVRLSWASNDYNRKGYNFLYAWGVCILFLLVSIIINIVGDYLPDFSLSQSVVSKYTYFDEKKTKLLFYEEAKSNIAFGCLYYFLMIFLEISKEWLFQVKERRNQA